MGVPAGAESGHTPAERERFNWTGLAGATAASGPGSMTPGHESATRDCRVCGISAPSRPASRAARLD
jgi:hypothetical protein